MPEMIMIRGSTAILGKAWTAEGDRYLLPETAWPPAHYTDAFSQHHRLVDVMGGVDNQFLIILPDSEQLFLGHQPGLGIQGAKRLIHQ